MTFMERSDFEDFCKLSKSDILRKVTFVDCRKVTVTYYKSDMLEKLKSDKILCQFFDRKKFTR